MRSLRAVGVAGLVLVSVAVCAAPVLVSVAVCAAPAVIQPLQLARLERAVASIPLGEGRVVASTSRSGHVWGRSCDAEAWALVASPSAPEAFVAGLPATIDLPEPGRGPESWSLALEVWKVAEDGTVVEVGVDGSTVALAEDGTVPGRNAFLLPVERDDLKALVAANPVEPGLNRYALLARAEFRDHGLPLECPR